MHRRYTQGIEIGICVGVRGILSEGEPQCGDQHQLAKSQTKGVQRVMHARKIFYPLLVSKMCCDIRHRLDLGAGSRTWIWFSANAAEDNGVVDNGAKGTTHLPQRSQRQESWSWLPHRLPRQ